MKHREEVRKALQQVYKEKLDGDPEEIGHVEIDDNYDFIVSNRDRTASVNIPKNIMETYLASASGREHAERQIMEILAFLGGTPASY